MFLLFTKYLTVFIFQGRYVAKWERGKLLEGKYFFYDNLEYIDSEKAIAEANAAKKLHTKNPEE